MSLTSNIPNLVDHGWNDKVSSHTVQQLDSYLPGRPYLYPTKGGNDYTVTPVPENKGYVEYTPEVDNWKKKEETTPTKEEEKKEKATPTKEQPSP